MVQTANPAGNFFVLNGVLPCEGTKALPFRLDFSGGINGYLIDLTAESNQKQFTTIQTVWIDNADNDSALEIVCNTTDQRIIAPAGSQGFYALLLPTPPKLTVQTDGAFIVQIILLNFYIPPTVWDETPKSSGGLPQVDVPALDAVISGGAVKTTAQPFPISGMVDASGTITVGGTPQIAIAANAARERFIVSNPDTATETLYMRFGTGGYIPLLPGATWDESGSSIVGDAISLLATTTGHAFTAYSK